MTIIVPEKFDEEIEPTYIAVTSSDQVQIVPFKTNIMHILNEDATDGDTVTFVCLGAIDLYNFADTVLAGNERYYSIPSDCCVIKAYANGLEHTYQVRVHIIVDTTATATASGINVTKVSAGANITVSNAALAHAHGRRSRYKLVPGEEIIELIGYYEDIELTGEYITRIDLTGWLG